MHRDTWSATFMEELASFVSIHAVKTVVKNSVYTMSRSNIIMHRGRESGGTRRDMRHT